MNSQHGSGSQPRSHSEAPAEGDETMDYPEEREHSEDPAEGSDDELPA